MTTQKAGEGKPMDGDGQAGVDPVLQGSIGRKLRDVYQEVVNEEVPAKFLTLLQELKKKESGSGEAQS